MTTKQRNQKNLNEFAKKIKISNPKLSKNKIEDLLYFYKGGIINAFNLNIPMALKF